MADAQSNIKVSIDTTQALASIKNLQRQISAFHTSMAKSGAAANAVTSQMQQTLINSVNATGKFSAQMKTIKTTTESFTNSLEKNKFSMGEYFRYAGGASKSFGKLFKTEFDTINKVARENVKDLQTQYIKLGRDANGSMKAIAVRPLSLDMNNLATKTMIASEKQAILNQLLKQGSTNLLNFGKNTQWAGRQLMVGFTVPLITVGSAAAKTFMDMETQAIKFKKVYGDIFTPQAEAATALDSIKNLGKEFTKYGVSVSATVGLAAQAAAAGFKGVDLQNQTTAATRLSILGQIDNQQALDTTIALQNAFSISSADLADNINFLNAVENQTVLSLDDITVAIPKAAPVVKQLGGNVKDLAFFLTAMKQGGIDATQGANALKSGLASMINPTSKATAMLAGFGINIKKIVVDNKGDLKKTVIDFATALNQLDPLNRAQAIEQMFGKFQFARISTLMQNVTAQGTQAAKVLDLAGASVQDLAGLSEKELGITADSAMNKFKASIENLKLSLVPVGEEFLKAVTPIAKFVSNILDKFNNLGSGTKKTIVLITTIVAGLGPVLLMTFGLLANGIANIIKGFTAVKTLFNRTGESSATLGTEVKYMTLEQRNAAAVASSLDQVHKNLAQTFTSETTAVNSLTAAYGRAIAAQRNFIPTGVPMRRGPVTKRATGKPSTVGGTGSKDSELSLLMPGETVIPTDMSKKYGGLINGMISNSIPGYAEGKVSMYPEYALRLQNSRENMGQRAGTTGVPNVLSPLALRIGEARGMAPSASQINSGKFDSIYKEYEKITTDFVTKLNTEYQTTFKDIKDENERMQKSWTSAGKAVETQVSSIKSEAERNVVSKTFGLSPDSYATIPTDSREVGGTTPNRARRGAFRSKLTGFRSYTALRPGSKKLYARMTGESADSLQMGHVFGPRTEDISTLQNDPRRTGAVDSAAKILARGKADGKAYEKGVKQTTTDMYPASQDRNSPHPLAAKDGKDDAIAYEKAKTKQLTQSGKKRRAAIRAQGPAPIGIEAPAGTNFLPITTRPQVTRGQKLAGAVRSGASRVGRLGGGMGLVGANMAMSAMPDFAGKDVIQSTMTGASMGMLFGPWGAAAGGAIGLVTSALGSLIAKEKEHEANVKATFSSSSEIINLFGDKVLDTSLKITNITKDSKNLADSLGSVSPEVQKLVDSIKALPEKNSLSIFLKNISDSSVGIKSLTGSIRSQVSTAIATGGLDPKNAEKYVQAILAAANRTSDFGKVWKSVSKDVVDVQTATTTSFNKMNQALKNTGDSFFYNSGGAIAYGKSYEALNAVQKAFADQLLNMFSITSNGSLKFDQLKIRIAGINSSSINAKIGVAALSSAINATGNKDAITRLGQIKTMYQEAGMAAQLSAGQIMMANAALQLTTEDAIKDFASKKGMRKASKAQQMNAYLKSKEFKDLYDSYQKIVSPAITTTNPYKDPLTGGAGSKADNLYLKVLQKEIDALKAKRDAQKNANDEVQREIDLKMKIQDLDSQATQAKISGNYLQASILGQEAKNVQMKFNKETELKKKDAEIAALEARYKAIKDGAKTTAAENAKVPKKANGGLISGPGSGRSDSIRASLGYAGGGSIRVSNGEFVVKASSVGQYGVAKMNAINNGTADVGTNSGGTVYNINMPITSNNASASGVAEEVMRRLKVELNKNNKSNAVRP